MSQLVFIRHGQASFFGPVYDRLSPLGERQAAHLGNYWKKQRLSFDHLFVGPKARHTGTQEHVQAVHDNGEQPWPEVVTLPELDEHQVFRLMTTRRAELRELSSNIASLADQLDNATQPQEQERAFQRLFEAVSRLWIDGHDFGVESWRSFQQRVNRAIDTIVAQADSGQRLAAFTSLGPITVAVQRALRCSDAVALETGWRIWNSSLTQFVFSGQRFTLEHFNAVPHLDHHEWTYR